MQSLTCNLGLGNDRDYGKSGCWECLFQVHQDGLRLVFRVNGRSPQVEVFGLRPFNQNTRRNPSWWVSESKLLKSVQIVVSMFFQFGDCAPLTGQRMGDYHIDHYSLCTVFYNDRLFYLYLWYTRFSNWSSFWLQRPIFISMEMYFRVG